MIKNKKLLAAVMILVLPFYAMGVDKVTFGPGTVPLGGMVAVVPNLDTANAWQPPASGVIKDGFMRADGATVPSGQGSPLQGKVLPNMTPSVGNDRYLKASRATSWTTGSYATSGANTYTPAGTVSQPSFTGAAGTYSVSVPAHYHTNGAGSALSTDTNTHTHRLKSLTYGTGYNGFVNINGNAKNMTDSPDGAYPESTMASLFNNSHAHGVTGSIGTVSGGSNGNAAFGASGTNTPSGTVSQPSFTGTSGNNEPAYLEVVYVIRVK
jgi:hypothetical protein